MENCTSGYEPSSIVETFHDIPHVDIDLGEINSTYEQTVEEYFEVSLIRSLNYSSMLLCIITLGYYRLVMLASTIRNHFDHTILFVLGSVMVLRVLYEDGFVSNLPRTVKMDKILAYRFTADLHSARHVSKNSHK